MKPRVVPILVAALLVAGCAGSAKLTKQSEETLAKGNAWKAWELATRALDKEPGNPKAREAATAAGSAIAEEWQRRIRALAEGDTLVAADQVLELAAFRMDAARYATIPVGASWPAEEQAIRQSAARTLYARGAEALRERRPKQAYLDLTRAQQFVANYRDAAKLASKAYDKARTLVALVPFRSTYDKPSLGVEVASRWKENLADDMAEKAQFTRILGGDAVERSITVAQLAGITREDAVRLGRKAGAQRVVWGSVGRAHSETRIHFFREAVSRCVKERDSAGNETVRWVEVPIEVVSRVRDVTVGVEYEVIAVPDGSSLAQKRFERSTSARVVWTSYVPEGEIDAYYLVSEALRASNRSRAQEIETRWKATCGEKTTLREVLGARRSAGSGGRYTRESLPRFIAGASFVFLEDLPPTDDLALAALARASGPLRDDLLRLDPVDEADLIVEADRPH